MRELERNRIGVIEPNTNHVLPIHFGYFLKVVSFIGVNPVNEAYITDGNLDRLFPTKGEAMEYATNEMDCGQVVYTSFKNEHCSITAHVRDNPFFNVKPTDYTLTYF